MQVGLDEALDAAAIVADAAEASGHPGWDDAPVREPLAVLLDALEGEARLHAAGRLGAGRRIRNLLTSYARMQRDAIEWPAVLEVRVESPIVVIGLPRSGTTMLHSLMAADPAHRSPQWWESLYPSPPPEEASYATDPRRSVVQAELDAMLERSPALFSALPYAADLAAECNTLVQPSLRTVAFGAAFHVPSFERWYLASDQRLMYAYHRRSLQQLSWLGPRGRWTLKSPTHLFTMPELVAEYPDATLIHIHRDPLTAVASNASLYHANRIVNTDHADPHETAGNVLDLWAEGAMRARRFREERPGVRVIDLTYDELTADPIGTTGALYRQMGETRSEAAEQAMREWLVRNDRSKRTEHRYALADFGLSQDEIRERFGAYEPRSSL
jgi:LPS sulfotransferase NodH